MWTATSPGFRSALAAPMEPDAMADHAELIPVAGQAFGTDNYTCFGNEGICGDSAGMRAEPTHWWLGLDGSGQAHYACSYCAPSLFGLRPVRN